MTSNWLFTESELLASPSRNDGVPLNEEKLRRRKACMFTVKLAGALHVAMPVQRAAAVYLHRFFMRRSMRHHDEFEVAAACLLLASKAEESEAGTVEVDRLASAFIHCEKALKAKQSAFSGQRRVAKDVVRRILEVEGTVLLALDYELEVDHAFTHIAANVDKVLALVFAADATTDIALVRQKMQQTAWSFLNDSASTWACVCIDAPVAAAAAVYAAGLQVLAAYTAPFVEPDVLPRGLVELMADFHPKTETNQSSCGSGQTCLREAALATSSGCVSAQSNIKVVDIETDIHFQNLDDSSGDEAAFIQRSTAWIDACVVSVQAQCKGEGRPCDPIDMTKGIRLRYGQDLVIDTCLQTPVVLKRSRLRPHNERSTKRAKLVT
ncbi:hypothetical protein BBJ28_00017310 [Nothophytophthora sp. Chile5]|nr:hypothetical protein BBJ28_00017310 [Nothophytophthora sp. Chile5]